MLDIIFTIAPWFVLFALAVRELLKHHRLFGIGPKGSATARLAEHDNKLDTLKKSVADQKDAALELHDSLDEVNQFLG